MIKRAVGGRRDPRVLRDLGQFHRRLARERVPNPAGDDIAAGQDLVRIERIWHLGLTNGDNTNVHDLIQQVRDNLFGIAVALVQLHFGKVGLKGSKHRQHNTVHENGAAHHAHGTTLSCLELRNHL